MAARSGGRRRRLALAAFPGFLGKPGLAADRDIVVAIGEFGHHGTGHAGIGLRHQALQLGAAGGEDLALALQLLAVVEIVFGRIGEGDTHAVTHAGAAAEPGGYEQCRRDGGSGER